ncbi:MAG: response regulator [Planctomycetota bacterium]
MRTGRASNSLRLTRGDLNRLLDRLDSQDPPLPASRQHVRRSFRRPLVLLELMQHGAVTSKLLVATRNISDSGMSLLHAAYVHAGGDARVTIPEPGGGAWRIKGKIARCSHVEGNVHEIGLVFDEQISTREILRIDHMEDCFGMERVDPSALAGSVLVVEDSEMDAKLVAKMLENTSLEVRVTDSIERALEIASNGVDLVLADYHLGDETSERLPDLLREAGLRVPVVVVTGDRRVETREAMRQAGANGLVHKPIDRDLLLRVLAEFLLTGGGSGPMHTTLAEDDPASDLVEPFVADVQTSAARLEKAIREADEQTCLEISRRLMGQAPSLGFGDLGRHAEEAFKVLAACMDVRESSGELWRLAHSCGRVRARTAA